jgi:phospho-N-acetylmuramoyl-pentapeptide-transferase
MLDKFFPLYLFCFVLALILTVVFEKKLIPILKARAKQPIYLDGPSWHQSKNGTPTMGGIGFIGAITASLLISLSIIRFELDFNQIVSLLLVIGYGISNALIGFIDDKRKLKRKKNEGGLRPIEKIIFQLILAVIFLILKNSLLGQNTALSFSFGKVELGFFYYPLTLFILLGMINSVNLTDGIDGLLASVTFAVSISLFYISASINTEVTLLSAALIAGTVGFLIFNISPAKIFMGDTGSLFFGAVLSAISVVLDNPLIIVFVGGVFALEGLSVALQVIFYKLFHKRIFKMSPFHHHLEKCGFSENKICIIAILASFIFSIPVYIFYLP